ncbi:hypothetical protein [[Clostridium] fimetarium]|nr:hypothetical protein [[Clostridium] fimetarium]
MFHIGTVAAKANEHSDTPYTFGFDTYQGYTQTETRPKTYTSYMYMYCTSSEILGTVYSAEAYGADWEYSYGERCSKNGVWKKYFTEGTKLPITNDVYEKRFRDAFIQGSLVNDQGFGSCMFWGLWSPDSIGY